MRGEEMPVRTTTLMRQGPPTILLGRQLFAAETKQLGRAKAAKSCQQRAANRSVRGSRKRRKTVARSLLRCAGVNVNMASMAPIEEAQMRESGVKMRAGDSE